MSYFLLRRIGGEFLLPLAAFFCSVCCEFTKDKAQAEEHIKSIEHNNKFKVCHLLTTIQRWNFDASHLKFVIVYWFQVLVFGFSK